MRGLRSWEVPLLVDEVCVLPVVDHLECLLIHFRNLEREEKSGRSFARSFSSAPLIRSVVSSSFPGEWNCLSLLMQLRRFLTGSQVSSESGYPFQWIRYL